MPTDQNHHETARAMIRRHGATATAVSRRWARLNRAANEYEAASLWDRVAAAVEGILSGHRSREQEAF